MNTDARAGNYMAQKEARGLPRAHFKLSRAQRRRLQRKSQGSWKLSGYYYYKRPWAKEPEYIEGYTPKVHGVDI